MTSIVDTTTLVHTEDIRSYDLRKEMMFEKGRILAYPDLLEFASDEIKNDLEFLSILIKKSGYEMNDPEQPFLRFIGENARNNPDIIFQIGIQYASPLLKKDIDLFIRFMKASPKIIQLPPQAILSSRDGYGDITGYKHPTKSLYLHKDNYYKYNREEMILDDKDEIIKIMSFIYTEGYCKGYYSKRSDNISSISPYFSENITKKYLRDIRLWYVKHYYVKDDILELWDMLDSIGEIYDYRVDTLGYDPNWFTWGAFKKEHQRRIKLQSESENTDKKVLDKKKKWWK